MTTASDGNEYLRSLRGLSRNVWLWLFAWFGAVGFSFFGIFGVVFNLYVVRLGFGTETVGLLHSVMTLSLAAVSVPAGLLGTRFGGKRFMILGLIGMGGAYAILAAANLGPPHLRIVYLIVGVVISGAAAGLFLVNAVPVFTGFTDPRYRPLAFALFAAAEPLGGFVGSLVAGILPGLFAAGFGWSLAGPFPYQATLLIPVVVVSTAAVAIGATTFPDTQKSDARGDLRAGDAPSLEDNPKRPSDAAAAVLPVTLVLVISLVAAMRMPVTMFIRSFFNVYTESVLGGEVSGIGAALGLAQLVMVPFILLSPALTSRFGKEKTFVAGVAVSAGGAVIMALVPRFAAAVAALLVVNIGFALSNPIFNQYQQEVVKPRYRATISGIVVLSQSFGVSAMNFAGGRLIPEIGYPGVFLITAGIAMAASTLFGSYFMGFKGRQNRSL